MLNVSIDQNSILLIEAINRCLQVMILYLILRTASSLYETCLQGIMVVVFIILDWISHRGNWPLFFSCLYSCVSPGLSIIMTTGHHSELTNAKWCDFFYFCALLAPVVQRLDNVIHRINHYPADKCSQNKPRYPLDSDLSDG